MDVLRWHPASSVPETIRATLAEGLTYSNWLVDRAPEHPALSVHEYRKTVRRMRAIVRLFRHLIGPAAYRSLDTGLRSAVTPTSGLRDARILLGALELAGGEKGSAGIREALAAQWRGRLEQMESRGEESRVLAASRAPLRRIAGELRSALPAEIAPEELRAAVARSYRKARRAFRAALRGGEDAEIHCARKRAKELRYQLEWLARVSGKRTLRRWKRLSGLAQDLGEVTDLFILERAVLGQAPPLLSQPTSAGGAPGGNGAAHPPLGLAPFAERVREAAFERWEEVAEQHSSLFEERPKRFARGVAKKLPSLR